MGERLNLRWGALALLILGGVLSSYLITYVPATGYWLSYLFCVYASYGLFFSGKTLAQGYRLFRKGNEPDIGLVSHVLSVAGMRRELVRASQHIDVFLIGILSINPPGWFNKFFTASMFFLVYLLNVNATLDDSLDGRAKKASAIETRREVEGLRRQRRRNA